ncbi:MAG: YchF-related putative GTPase [Candidatus Anstonellaceae archaeon]
MIKIGLIGAPNKGKSTLFAALTKNQVAIADYPFTTIAPNVGVAFLPKECVCSKLGIKCDSPYCDGKYRYLGVEIVDVAGLVEGAYLGRGMGNKFLDDLIKADGFIQVIDASGQTDLDGKNTMDFPIEKEIGFLKNELLQWLVGILRRNYPKYKFKKIDEMYKELSGLKIEYEKLKETAMELKINLERVELDEKKMFELAEKIIKLKPLVIAANKSDKKGALERIEEFKKNHKEIDIIACSADYEYTLNLAANKKLIDYKYAENRIKIIKELPLEQKNAIEKILEFVNINNGTGVWNLLEKLVFEKMEMLVAYPVENEEKFSDSAGRVLPDAFLIKKGTKIIEFAQMVHSDFAKYFVSAIDAKTKKNLSKEYIIKDNDIIKLIAAKR